MNNIYSFRFLAHPSRIALQRPGAGGFTLIELLIVMVVAAILASIAAPSMTEFIASQRAKSVATNLHLALTVARSEATKRNADVSMVANTGGWKNGWLIYPTATTTNTIQSYDAAKNVDVAAGGVTTVVYRNSGRVQAAVTFVITVSGHTAASRCVSVDLSGRPYVKAGTSC